MALFKHKTAVTLTLCFRFGQGDQFLSYFALK